MPIQGVWFQHYFILSFSLNRFVKQIKFQISTTCIIHDGYHAKGFCHKTLFNLLQTSSVFSFLAFCAFLVVF